MLASATSPQSSTTKDDSQLQQGLSVAVAHLAVRSTRRAVDVSDRVGHAFGAARKITTAQRLRSRGRSVPPGPSTVCVLQEFPVVHGTCSFRRQAQLSGSAFHCPYNGREQDC